MTEDQECEGTFVMGVRAMQAELHAIIAAEEERAEQKLTLPEAVKAAKGIRERAEQRRRESDEAEAKAEAGLCPTCHGNGTISVRETGGMIIGTAVCPDCNGNCRAHPTPSDGLRKAIEEAMEYAGNRWSEWGERALGVCKMLDDALSSMPVKEAPHDK